MGESLIRLGHDWAAVVEAAERDVQDDEDWAAGIAAKLARSARTQHDPTLVVVEHDPTCSTARYRTASTARTFEPAPGIDQNAGLSLLGVDGFRAFYYPSRVVTTHHEIARDLSVGKRTDISARAASLRAQRDVTDVLGAFAYPEPGIILSLYAVHDRPVVISRYERTLLARLMFHFESAYRLRRRPEAIVAVLDADRRVIERSPHAPPDDVMTAHVAQRQVSRHSLWPAMLAGRLSVVPRGSGRRRRYFVLENPPSSQSLRALTPSEVAVLSQAAHGHSTKLIAFALGISPSLVSARLTSAASKLGVATRMELVRIAAMLTRDPRAGFENIALTDAERDVLELVQRGLSNDAIAAMRSRSARTIANQVASLLRKTKAVSRRGLVTGRAGEGT